MFSTGSAQKSSEALTYHADATVSRSPGPRQNWSARALGLFGIYVTWGPDHVTIQQRGPY